MQIAVGSSFRESACRSRRSFRKDGRFDSVLAVAFSLCPKQHSLLEACRQKRGPQFSLVREFSSRRATSAVLSEELSDAPAHGTMTAAVRRGLLYRGRRGVRARRASGPRVRQCGRTARLRVRQGRPPRGSACDRPPAATVVSGAIRLGYDRARYVRSFGKRQEALAELDRACAERSRLVALLKVDPSFDELRSDPRFQSLVTRLKFPE